MAFDFPSEFEEKFAGYVPADMKDILDLDNEGNMTVPGLERINTELSDLAIMSAGALGTWISSAIGLQAVVAKILAVVLIPASFSIPIIGILVAALFALVKWIGVFGDTELDMDRLNRLFWDTGLKLRRSILEVRRELTESIKRHDELVRKTGKVPVALFPGAREGQEAARKLSAKIMFFKNSVPDFGAQVLLQKPFRIYQEWRSIVNEAHRLSSLLEHTLDGERVRKLQEMNDLAFYLENDCLAFVKKSDLELEGQVSELVDPVQIISLVAKVGGKPTAPSTTSAVGWRAPVVWIDKRKLGWSYDKHRKSWLTRSGITERQFWIDTKPKGAWIHLDTGKTTALDKLEVGEEYAPARTVVKKKKDGIGAATYAVAAAVALYVLSNSRSL